MSFGMFKLLYKSTITGVVRVPLLVMSAMAISANTTRSVYESIPEIWKKEKRVAKTRLLMSDLVQQAIINQYISEVEERTRALETSYYDKILELHPSLAGRKLRPNKDTTLSVRTTLEEEDTTDERTATIVPKVPSEASSI